MEYNYKKRGTKRRYRYKDADKNRRTQMIKTGGAALTGVLVVGVIIYSFGKFRQEEFMDSKTLLAEEIHGEMELPIHEDTTPKETEGTEESKQTEKESEGFEYPAIDGSYVDIVAEEVKSPYVALLDVENNTIIAGRNVNARIYPASMTKVLSLIVAVEQITDLSATFTMTGEIVDPLVEAEASRAGFEAGDTVSAKDMLYGMVLASGADAAMGLAIIAAGSEAAFVDLMNEKCDELGLVNSHFTNASGLFNENQYTTPTEMALILKHAMQNETCAEILSTYQYSTAPTQSKPLGILLTSTMFSRMYGTEVEGVTITAGKTGYTDEAGNCLVSFAQKGEKHYIALTAGAQSKWHVIFDDFEIYKNYLPDAKPLL